MNKTELEKLVFDMIRITKDIIKLEMNNVDYILDLNERLKKLEEIDNNKQIA